MDAVAQNALHKQVKYSHTRPPQREVLTYSYKMLFCMRILTNLIKKMNMKNKLSRLVVITVFFSITCIVSAHAQECAPLSFKQVIEKMDSFNISISKVQDSCYAIQRIYTQTIETSRHPGFFIRTIDEKVSPELYFDSKYIQLKDTYKKVRNAYAGFVVPLIAKSQNIAELLYYYEYNTEDSLVFEEVVKNQTFQNFAQMTYIQTRYTLYSDSALVLETEKPLTEYSATELWWILRSFEEYKYLNNSYFNDSISIEMKKVFRKKIESCWVLEKIYNNGKHYVSLDPVN